MSFEYLYADEKDALVDIIRNNDSYWAMFYGWMEDCASQGYTEVQAERELAFRLQEWVSAKYDEAYDILANAACDVALTLFMNDDTIDYDGAAYDLMNDEETYDDLLSASIRSAASAAYGKTKAAGKKAVTKTKAAGSKAAAKTKQAASKAKSKTQTKRKPASQSTRRR